MFFLRQAINVSYINTTISIVNHVDENVFGVVSLLISLLILIVLISVLNILSTSNHSTHSNVGITHFSHCHVL